MRWAIKVLLDSIRAWNSATVEMEIPVGLSRGEATRCAQTMLTDLARGDATPILSFREGLPDVLYALCDLLVRNQEVQERPELLTRLYELVLQIRWPYDDFGEKADVLALITQLAWSSHLGRSAGSETARWERASLNQFLVRQEVSECFALAAGSWTAKTCDQLITDRATLLGLCIWLRETVNSNSRLAGERAKVVHCWLANQCRLENEWPEDAYLLVELALTAAGTSRLGGRYGEAREWISVADYWCEFSKDPPVSSARVEYARLAVSHDVRLYEETLLRVEPLVERFRQMGLLESMAKARILQAAVMKELDRDSEALDVILSLENDPAVTTQSWLHGVVLTTRAELESRARRPAVALRCVQRADFLLRDTEMPFARAHCCGIAGEILRDHGRLSAAAECYRRAVEIYLSGDMPVYAAYTSLLLAETLVGLGREEEAVDVIVAALPTIAREHLVREGIAAVGLLKASLSRRKLDSEALKALRESLDRSRQEGES